MSRPSALAGAVIALACLISATSGRAQSPCGYPTGSEPSWCDRTSNGPDRVPGTADDRPDCVASAGTGSLSACSQSSGTDWSFQASPACNDCAYQLFVGLDCGNPFYLFISNAEGMRVDVADIAAGPATLTAENECAIRRDAGNPFLYCDACSPVNQLLAKDDAINDPSFTKPAGSCTLMSPLGPLPAPEVLCLAWRASGTSVAWGLPVDQDPGPNEVFDADGDGFVDQTDGVPCMACESAPCRCGHRSSEHRMATAQFVRIRVEPSPTPFGDSRVLRVSLRSAGSRPWSIVARCDAEPFSDALLMHGRCEDASAAIQDRSGRPNLSLPAAPARGFDVVDASACPDRLVVAVTLCNSGDVPAPMAPFSIRWDPESPPDPLALGDNAAHPTDPACQTPLLPGECRTCEWTLVGPAPPGARLRLFVDRFDQVEEACDLDRGANGCGIGPETVTLAWCDGPPACTASATISAPAGVACPGTTVTLSGTATVSAACAGVAELQYEDASGPLPGGAFPAPPTLDWLPPGPGTHAVHARSRCSTDPACTARSASATVRVAEPLVFASAIAAVQEGDCPIRVTWSAASDPAATYDVYRSDTLPVPLDAAHRVASGLAATTYLDVAPWGTTWHYRVEAVGPCERVPNDAGDSAGVTVVDLAPPTFAGVENTRDLGRCQVEVLWNDATAVDACSGMAGFNVYRDNGVGRRGRTRIATLVPGSPYVDTTPGNGTWTYVVRAQDRSGREEQNDVFQQESENSCTNDFPRDAGLDRENGIDSPNADGGHAAPRPGLGAGRERRVEDLRVMRSRLHDGLRIRWNPSPDEGGLYPITYSVLRGSLRDLPTGYQHALVAPDACGIAEHEYRTPPQDDGQASYYIVVPVSGDNATFGYDSDGRERPAVVVCE